MSGTTPSAPSPENLGGIGYHLLEEVRRLNDELKSLRTLITEQYVTRRDIENMIEPLKRITYGLVIAIIGIFWKIIIDLVK